MGFLKALVVVVFAFVSFKNHMDVIQVTDCDQCYGDSFVHFVRCCKSWCVFVGSFDLDHAGKPTYLARKWTLSRLVPVKKKGSFPVVFGSLTGGYLSWIFDDLPVTLL